MATTAALLQHLKKFPEGLTFSEIQRFIVEANGYDYDEKVVANQWEVNSGAEPKYIRRHRGYWCDRLCSGQRYVITDTDRHGNALRAGYIPKPGIFETYCNKVGNRYVLKEGVEV